MGQQTLAREIVDPAQLGDGAQRKHGGSAQNVGRSAGDLVD
jgi:hypothetical protein